MLIITKSLPCTISATSRTDRGVHAQGQICKITFPIYLKPDALFRALNALLPLDIRILSCEPSTKEYLPSQSSTSKEYHYYFSPQKEEQIAISDSVLFVEFENKIDILLLRSACKLFIGVQDFHNFSNRDSRVITTEREILHCDIHSTSFSPITDEVYYLKIVGKGFLKHMVRFIMGSLLDLANGKIKIEDIKRAMTVHQALKLSAKAEAKGLHLISIDE
jgi:tRNA pseudouridine38-40 synthase